MVLDRSYFEIKSGEKQTKNSTSRALTIRLDQSNPVSTRARLIRNKPGPAQKESGSDSSSSTSSMHI
jgi:hypothetical protein